MKIKNSCNNKNYNPALHSGLIELQRVVSGQFGGPTRAAPLSSLDSGTQTPAQPLEGHVASSPEPEGLLGLEPGLLISGHFSPVSQGTRGSVCRRAGGEVWDGGLGDGGMVYKPEPSLRGPLLDNSSFGVLSPPDP